jgi:predicted small integral membrane protein
LFLPGPAAEFLVWFVAFLAVEGEWFAMWQSQLWNGRQRAFRILASILLVLISSPNRMPSFDSRRAAESGPSAIAMQWQVCVE